jgi:outer membrane protein
LFATRPAVAEIAGRPVEREISVNISTRCAVLATAAVFLLLAVVPCVTAQAAGESIAVLNLRKVFAASEAGKKAQQEMDKKVKELQEKFKNDEDALAALQDEIEKKSSVWNEEKKQEKAIEFQKMRRDLRVKQEDANLELKKIEEQQLSPIRKELEQVIEKMAKEKGLNIILPSEVVMYFSDAVDITDEVTSSLNAASGK